MHIDSLLNIIITSFDHELSSTYRMINVNLWKKSFLLRRNMYYYSLSGLLSNYLYDKKMKEIGQIDWYIKQLWVLNEKKNDGLTNFYDYESDN